MRTPVEWLEKAMALYVERCSLQKEFEQAKKMETKNKLEKQLFIGKVSEIIGFEKTVELLKESKQAIKEI